jgi:hypothetical protein
MSTIDERILTSAYLVDDLESRVGLADVQTTLVRFPTEPHPGVDDGSLDPVLVLAGSILLDQRVDQQGIRLQRQLQVVLDITLLGLGRRFLAQDGLGFLLCLCQSLLTSGNELVDNLFDTGDRDGLGGDSVKTEGVSC